MPDDTSNIVINNLLCYISTARHAISKEQIISCCWSFYDLNIVKEAKEILFAANNDKPVRRRGDVALKHELEDIYDKFVKYDECNIPLPKFVADNYSAMPPTSGYELIGSTIVNLINEIAALKEEIKEVKNNNFLNDILCNDVKNMKDDIMEINNNMRNLKMQFFEKEIRRLSNVETLKKCNDIESFTSSAPTLSQFDHGSSAEAHPLSSSNSEPSPLNLDVNTRTFDCSYSDATKRNVSLPRHSMAKNTMINYKSAEIVSSSSRGNQPDEDGFQLVSKNNRKNKSKYGIVGNKVTGSIKCAIRNYDLYLGNCDLDIEENDIIKYVKDECNIDILYCNQLSTSSEYSKSFKLTTSLNDRDILLNPELWPKGIVCRKFYNSKSKK